MDINYYQRLSHETAMYPGQGTMVGMMYAGLGLAGEAGEVVEHIKKAYRDEIYDGRDDILLELGDVMWYVAEIATANGLSMGEVLQANLDKLADRQKRGVIQGSGDHR